MYEIFFPHIFLCQQKAKVQNKKKTCDLTKENGPFCWNKEICFVSEVGILINESQYACVPRKDSFHGRRRHSAAAVWPKRSLLQHWLRVIGTFTRSQSCFRNFVQENYGRKSSAFSDQILQMDLRGHSFLQTMHNVLLHAK